MCLFRGLLDDGDFDAIFLDVNLIRFCFLHLVQVLFLVLFQNYIYAYLNFFRCI